MNIIVAIRPLHKLSEAAPDSQRYLCNGDVTTRFLQRPHGPIWEQRTTRTRGAVRMQGRYGNTDTSGRHAHDQGTSTHMPNTKHANLRLSDCRKSRFRSKYAAISGKLTIASTRVSSLTIGSSNSNPNNDSKKGMARCPCSVNLAIAIHPAPTVRNGQSTGHNSTLVGF